MRPKISIIVVVRNAAKELKTTLQSLVALDYEAKEIIVIDGDSTDQTQEVIHFFAENLSYWVSEPDKGLYDAMNKGVKQATGEYLWFINAGDMPYSDDVLEDAIVPTEHYADIYYGEAMIVNTEGEELGLRRKVVPEKLTLRSFRKGMVVCHQAFIVRREIAPLYDTSLRYVADIKWVMDCLQGAKTIVNTNRVLCKFVEGGISTNHRRSSLIERWGVMRARYGFWATFAAHVGFAFEGVLRRGYRSTER